MTGINEAFRRFDEENAKDPNKVEYNGEMVAKEILYAQRMTDCLESYAPDAPLEVKLAARSQHIRRWHIPREKYPMNRAGYHKWRKELAEYHAELAGNILNDTGFSRDVIEAVQALLKKENLQKKDLDAQLLEDVICLVFLEFYFEDFAASHEEKKVLDIVCKTWKKMSEKGHETALKLPLSPVAKRLVQKALA